MPSSASVSASAPAFSHNPSSRSDASLIRHVKNAGKRLPGIAELKAKCKVVAKERKSYNAKKYKLAFSESLLLEGSLQAMENSLSREKHGLESSLNEQIMKTEGCMVMSYLDVCKSSFMLQGVYRIVAASEKEPNVFTVSPVMSKWGWRGYANGPYVFLWPKADPLPRNLEFPSISKAHGLDYRNMIIQHEYNHIALNNEIDFFSIAGGLNLATRVTGLTSIYGFCLSWSETHGFLSGAIRAPGEFALYAASRLVGRRNFGLHAKAIKKITSFLGKDLDSVGKLGAEKAMLEIEGWLSKGRKSLVWLEKKLCLPAFAGELEGISSRDVEWISLNVSRSRDLLSKDALACFKSIGAETERMLENLELVLRLAKAKK